LTPEELDNELFFDFDDSDIEETILNENLEDDPS